MKRLTRFQENISVRKATNYAIIINSLEILLILGVMTLVVISPQYDFSPRMMRLLVGVAAAVIIWGAVMDIREAMSTRRLLSQLDAMDDTIDAMEKLNNTLRAQRHDFLNHLQVVYSLMEMEEYGEANSYIEKVYGRITAVSRVLKTASAPINALLQVKLAACEKAGVQVTLNITSTWKELPISGWEMCKVLSNLIDNAIDAMADLPDGKKASDHYLDREPQRVRLFRCEHGHADCARRPAAHFRAGRDDKVRRSWHGAVHRPGNAAALRR